MGGCLAVQLSCDQALSQACSCCFGDGNYIHTMKSNLESLEKTMQELKERRDDLSRRVSIEEDKGFQRFAQVQGWLSRVQDIEYQVSDLLETKSSESQQLCLFGYCSNKCISSCAYGKKVSKKLKEVQELLSKGAFDVLTEKAHVQKVVKQHIKTTFGLDSMVEKTWNILKNPRVTTLGLYGMGGVGKTTLLARINNKFIEEVNESDIVIWVVVSKDLGIQGIQNHILRRLRPDKWKQETTEEEKAFFIYNILSRKKFVLLLDNLWDEVDLNKIGVPPLDNGSKIVFTTRSKEVCRAMGHVVEMQVECLSNDEAWELFRNTVGENVLKRHQNIPTLAREVAEKCCGLPLALTVIGKAMASQENVHEWGYALRLLNSYNHTFPGMEEKILSILKFSYDGLGDKNVKSCFLYCSLFPKDYEIEKEKLIEYWICEGLINGHREEDGSSSQGHAIIGSLVRAQLLMEVYGESTEKVKMHDVLREMALWIGSDFVKSGAQLRVIPNDIKWEVVRRICLMCNQIKEISCYPIPRCPNLTTLLLGYNRLMGISHEFFRFMSALVVLDLSWNHSLTRLPTEISTLSSLKYLNISYTGILCLPIGLEELNKLISLDIEGTAIENIDGIGRSLPNLQVLKLYGSEVSINERSMEELQLLEHLEILTADVCTALDLERIQRVKRLANCIRVLCLKKMIEKVVVLDTEALGGLQRLVIMDCKISEIDTEWKRRYERGELGYTRYSGFKHLSTVQINFLDGPEDLTWLFFAQNLRALTVWGSRSIEEIINEEKIMSERDMHISLLYVQAPLEKLEYLSLYDLSELKRISSSFHAIILNLREFVVDMCPKMNIRHWVSTA